MSPRKTFLTAGVIWAPLLAFAAASAALHIFLRAGDFASLGLAAAALAALLAFAGSIVAGARYGKRLARKGPWAGKFGALLVVLGIMANVFLALGVLGLVLPHDDDMNFDFVAEQQARESAGEQ